MPLNAMTHRCAWRDRKPWDHPQATRCENLIGAGQLTCESHRCDYRYGEGQLRAGQTCGRDAECGRTRCNFHLNDPDPHPGHPTTDWTDSQARRLYEGYREDTRRRLSQQVPPGKTEKAGFVAEWPEMTDRWNRRKAGARSTTMTGTTTDFGDGPLPTCRCHSGRTCRKCRKAENHRQWATGDGATDA